MRSITASFVVSIKDIVGEQNLISVSAGPARDLVFLSLKENPDYRILQPGWASFAKNRADQLNNFTVHHLIGGNVRTFEISPTAENYYFVQPLPAGDWIIARSRTESESDANAHIYSSAGKRKFSFHAGDAIEHLQTTENGQVWIGYFDEAAAVGVGIGGKGLVGFDAFGRLIFDFDHLVEKHDLPRIDDCYAMNVAGPDEVWVCYYSEFPLVKIVNHALDRVCKDFPIGGASGFAVASGRGLFGGLYSKPDSLFMVELETLDFEELSVVRMDEPIAFKSVFGRGSSLYLRTESEILRIDVGVD